MGITDYGFLETEEDQSAPQPTDLNSLVARVLAMEEQAKDIKDQISITKDQIIDNLRSAQGFANDLNQKLDLEVPVDSGVIKVKFPEKWEWDADKLFDLFSGHPIPSYVTRKLSITKANYERLSPTVKAAVDPALSTRVEDEPTVGVKPHKKESKS